MKTRIVLLSILLLILNPSCTPQEEQRVMEEITVKSQETTEGRSSEMVAAEPVDDESKGASEDIQHPFENVHDYVAQLSDPTHITIGVQGEITIDPAKTWPWEMVQASDLLFLGLTRIDPETGEVKPELALTFERMDAYSIDGGPVWVIQMREDVSWVDRDGQITAPVTAYDAVFAIQRALDRRTGASYPELLYIIENAEEVHALEEPTQEDLQSIGVWAEGDYTIKFRLLEPISYFPVLLSLPITKPVPRQIVEEYGEEWIESGEYWSNGPYLFAHLSPEEMMVLCKEITEDCSAANPHYYGIDEMDIQAIQLLALPFSNQAVASYLEGKLDFVEIYTQDWEMISIRPELMEDIHPFLDYATAGLGFNVGKPPLDDILVRQALAHLINRELLIATSSEAWQMPATTLTPPNIAGSPAYDPAFPHLAYDPALALEKFEQAGYPNGTGFPQLTLAVRAFRSEHEKMAQQIAETWNQVLGIDLEVVTLDPEFFYDQLDNNPPDLFLTYWYADYPDPHAMLFTNFHSTKGSNQIRWSNSEFDQLTRQAASESDPTRRREIYNAAEKIMIAEETGIIPIYYYTRYVIFRPIPETAHIAAGGLEQIWKWKVKAH